MHGLLSPLLLRERERMREREREREIERMCVCVDARGNARRGVAMQSVSGPRGSNGTAAVS